MKKTHPMLAGIESVKPYKIATGDSLYKVRPPIMTIENFLPASGLMGLTSQPGVGKTWLGLEAARAVSSGTPFLGKFKTIRGGVLFVGSDSSIYDYARQWSRLTRETPDAHEAFEPVRFLIQETFMFEDRDEVRRLIRTHQQFSWGETTYGPGNLPQRQGRGFHLIIFDTLSALTNVPESDNTGREQVFRMIRFLAEATDAAIILLHHNAQKSEFNDGTNFRGGTAQLARLDSHINITPSRKDPYLVGVQFKKFRGIKPTDFAYRMNVSDPLSASIVATDEPVTLGQKLQFDATAVAVHEYVRAHPGQRAFEIKDALWPKFEAGIDANGVTVVYATIQKLAVAVNNRLAALVNSGVLRRDLTGDGKTVYHAKAESDEASPAS